MDPGRLRRTVRITFKQLPRGDVHLCLYNHFIEEEGFPVEAFEGIGQLRGSKDWYILFSSIGFVEKAAELDERRLEKCEASFTVSSFLRKIVNLRVYWLPLSLDNDAVNGFVRQYGEILSSGFGKHQTTHLHNGMRWFRLSVPVSKVDYIPDVISIENFPALFVVLGRPPLCLRCEGRGHVRRECTAVPCAVCRSFRHRTVECKDSTWSDRVRARDAQKDLASVLPHEEVQHTCDQRSLPSEEAPVPSTDADGLDVNGDVVLERGGEGSGVACAALQSGDDVTQEGVDNMSPVLPPNRVVDASQEPPSTVVGVLTDCEVMSVCSPASSGLSSPDFNLVNLVQEGYPSAYSGDEMDFTVVRKRRNKRDSGTPEKHKKV